MESQERIIGQLEANHKATHERLIAIEQKSEKIEAKVDTILAWRWKLTGALTIVSFLVSSVVAFIVETFRKQ